MRVKIIEPHWKPWKRKILFIAKYKEVAIFDSFFGEKFYYVFPGDEYYVIVPKKWNLKINDDIALEKLIKEDSSDFNWGWEI